MQQFAFYLLKVIACSGILLLYYRLALRNKRFHYYNRFYLLATIAASLLLPLLNINWFTINSSNDKAIALMNVMYVQGGEVSVNSTSGFSINWQQLPVYIYTAVSVVFIGLLLWRVHKIYAFKKQYSATSMGEFDFINTDLSQAPFSFLHNLFWRSDIDLSDTTGRQILQHELTHIRQKHTWDKLWMQIVLGVFWINPFYWFIQKELYLLHEFIADEKAIENNDGAAFAAMLLTSQYGRHIFAPAQSFAYSPIKRRLFMLTNLTKPRYSYARRLMVLPLLACVVMLFAFRVKKKEEITIQDVYMGTASAPAFKVVIDAGHGGADDGLHVNNITEKDITLRIAQKVKQLAANYNIEVELARTGNINMNEADRVTFAVTHHADAFISLHVDYNENSTENYIGAYVSNSGKQFQESRLLASAIIQNLSQSFKTDNVLKQRQTPVKVLNSNPLPAVLLECGMMSSEEGIKNVTDDAKITLMAERILQGITNYATHTVTTPAIVAQNDLKDSLCIQPGEQKQNVIVDRRGLLITGRFDSVAKKPLIVINDKIEDNGLDKINPNDIDRISVLKDKTATEKYGDKGANGVVEVYTREYSPSAAIHDVEADLLPSTNPYKDEIRIERAKPGQGVKLTSANVSLIADTIVWDKGNGTLIAKGGVRGTAMPQNAVYGTAIEPAHFPGGRQAWQEYLERQLKTNLVINKGGLPGKYTATVAFTVDEEGILSDFKIVRDPGYGTGAEAVRVIQRGPKWVPAQQNGQPVKILQQQSVTWVVEK